ncbi:bZIP transcription factor PWA37_003036 [Arxiozyma heterogenica]|uniref:bZIP transcription factor n=1 Tax=Arxiozyma heterogenica TaxID=278026 RepID=UPI002F026198
MRNLEVDRYIQSLMTWDKDPATGATDLSERSKESKKKIQNRKAQKAFRLRKEAKMMELERKLNESEMIQSQLHEEVNKLKNENILINNVYRRLNNVHRKSPSLSPSNDSNSTSPPKYDVVFPTIGEFYNALIDNDSKHTNNHDQVSNLQYNDKDGNILLTIPATWKYLLDLHKKSSLAENNNNSSSSNSNNGAYNNTVTTSTSGDDGDWEENEMDIDLIMASLRGHEECHGHGPAYKKSLIDQVIKHHHRR